MATKLDVYQEAARIVADARLASVTDDVELRYAFDDAYAGAARQVLREAPWRFALVTSALQPSVGAALPGQVNRFAYPGDWLRTTAIFVLAGARECPVDLREMQSTIYSNETGLVMRYVSTVGLTEALWTAQFASLVAAYLAFLCADRVTGDPARAQAIYSLYQARLSEAAQIDAETSNPWLASQRDGTFLRAARAVLEMGFWRFSTKTAPLALGGTPTAGFRQAYAKPSDWLRTHSAFVLTATRESPVALREEGSTFSTNAPTLTIRYTSTTALDSRVWPDSFYAAVRSTLAANAATGEGRGAALQEMQGMVAASLATDGVPDDPWYRFQRSDAFAQGVAYVLTHGRWRFASKTVTLAAAGVPSSGMSYRYPLPADWLRTINLSTLREPATDLTDVDFHEEGKALHTDASPVTLRYVTTAGLDATAWPEGFRDVVLAYLEYREARDDPARSNLASNKLNLYRERSKAAELRDDQSERPRVNQVGRFVRGRFGGSYGEQGRRW